MGELNPIKHWNQQVFERADLSRTFLEGVLGAGVRFGDRPLCTMARPLILPAESVVRYSRMIRGFHEAIRFAREMVVSDGLDGDEDSLAIRLGLTPDALALAAIPVSDPSASVLSRIDSFCPNGHPWIIELNAESPAGMAYGDALSKFFENHPGLPDTHHLSSIQSSPAAVQAILDSYARAHGRSRRPRVAIVDFKEVSTWPEFLLFQERFEAQGIDCRVCDPGDLDFDGKKLVHQGTPIDLVYRRLLVDDFLSHPHRTEALLSAYREQRVLMVNSLRTTLLHCKGLFALLHDPMVFELLPTLAQEMIEAHIPWTGILSDEPGLGAPPDLKEVVRQNREMWVIKPLRGHGGTGIVVGSMVSESEWSQALERADSHVAQRYVGHSRELFPDAAQGMKLREMTVSLDPYLIRGRLAGFLCRLSDGPLGNVHQGGSQVPVMIHGQAPLDYLPDLAP